MLFRSGLVAAAYAPFVTAESLAGRESEFADYWTANKANSRVAAINRAAADAERAANPQPEPEVYTVATPAAPADTGGVAPNAAGFIGLRGETVKTAFLNGKAVKVKDVIKAVEKQLFGRWPEYSKDGTYTWLVHPETWTKLCADHPDAAKFLNVVPV